MSDSEGEQYSVPIDETLAGRKAGASAAGKARELRRENQVRTLFTRLTGRHSDDRAWRRGAHGEMFVGWLLGRLPDGWYVFNDIPVGERGANIDHLVVGPGGVFTVNTKNLTGKVWVAPRALLVNGRKTDYLPKASREARRAATRLALVLGRPVPVRGMLAIIAEDLVVKEQPSDVFVASPRGVKRWLLDRPRALTDREVLAVCAVATKPSTWTTKEAS
jgi:hypothetical protein